MAVTNSRDGKAAKRGTFTVHPPSNAFPVDGDGNVIPYQFQAFPHIAVKAIEGGFEERSCANEFELNQALAEGFSKTPLEALEAAAGSAVEPPAEESKPKKAGKAPKAEAVN